MAIFKHKRTGILYRELCDSFDVATQRHHKVYVSLENGQIFNRDWDIFAKNFELVNYNPQGDIIPKER